MKMPTIFSQLVLLLCLLCLCNRHFNTSRGSASLNGRAKGQVGFMWTFAQSAKAVNPPGTKALAAAVRISCSGPK